MSTLYWCYISINFYVKLELATAILFDTEKLSQRGDGLRHSHVAATVKSLVSLSHSRDQ